MENNNDGASNSPACAACRHQRKRCKVNECLIWPHFPSDRMEEFQAVHKVFGIANVTKMMKDLEGGQRAAAANSLFWEAKCWTEDPVHGPLGKFKRLEQQLNDTKASLLLSQTQQYQPANNLVAPPVRESLVNSNGGFQNPYPTNFGQHQHGIDLSWSGGPVRPYNQTQEIRNSLGIPPLQPRNNQPQSQVYNPSLNPNPSIADLMIRGDEYVETMYPGPPNLPVRDMDNIAREILPSPLGLPIIGEENVGTSFHSASHSNIRGDQDHVTTQFSTSTNLPVKTDDDDDLAAAFCQQRSRNSNPDDVRGRR